MIREKVVRFGASRGLVGIITEPAPGERPQAPVLLLNSGILHHVGASRIHVQLARRLAAQGHPSLRFDFSGIGDSESRRDALGAAESAVAETRDAITFLGERRGVSTGFVLFGLCSGADMAFKTAGVDDRVGAIVQLDPYAYRTPGYWLRHYGPKLLQPAAYARFAATRLRKLRPQAKPALDDPETMYVAPEYRRRFPPREQVAGQLRSLVDRSVRMLNVFSDGQTDHINHAQQYRAAFPDVPFGDLLKVVYLRGCSHTFTRPSDQEALLRIVTEWIGRDEDVGRLPVVGGAAQAPALARR